MLHDFIWVLCPFKTVGKPHINTYVNIITASGPVCIMHAYICFTTECTLWKCLKVQQPSPRLNGQNCYCLQTIDPSTVTTRQHCICGFYVWKASVWRYSILPHCLPKENTKIIYMLLQDLSVGLQYVITSKLCKQSWLQVFLCQQKFVFLHLFRFQNTMNSLVVQNTMNSLVVKKFP